MQQPSQPISSTHLEPVGEPIQEPCGSPILETFDELLTLGNSPFPPDVHESLEVEEGEFNVEQELALFDMNIAYHEQAQRIALLVLNRAKLQFRWDNEMLRKPRDRDTGSDVGVY
jgi:hypothetical protein